MGVRLFSEYLGCLPDETVWPPVVPTSCSLAAQFDEFLRGCPDYGLFLDMITLWPIVIVPRPTTLWTPMHAALESLLPVERR